MNNTVRTLTILILFFGVSFTYAQEELEIERIRALGYENKLEGEIDSAIYYYEKVLELNENDYDARLALARLFYGKEEYQQAERYYALIYKNDETDVEAHNGLGRVYYRTEEYRKAAYHFRKAVHYYPKSYNSYFDLAKSYIAIGELDSAILSYKELNKIDDTFSEAWQGIGKMLYWQGKPVSALEYYEKALELDPENEEIRAGYKKVLAETEYQAVGVFKVQSEKEEMYNIDALIQDYSLTKRFTDNWQLRLGFLLDYSERNYTDAAANTERWYDNTSLRVNYIIPNHTFSAFGGASINDTTVTSYGLTWKMNLPLGAVTLSNELTAAYDYFYYWNQVGMDYVRESLTLSYAGLSMEAQYRYAGVTAEGETLTGETSTHGQGSGRASSTKVNTSQFYALGLNYEILAAPRITLGISHSYMDYSFQSPLFYTPSERSLYGAGVRMYHSIGSWYFYGSFTQRIDNNDVENWSAAIEAGYSFDWLHLSMGASRYNDPFYETTTTFISIKGLF